MTTATDTVNAKLQPRVPRVPQRGTAVANIAIACSSASPVDPVDGVLDDPIVGPDHCRLDEPLDVVGGASSGESAQQVPDPREGELRIDWNARRSTGTACDEPIKNVSDQLKMVDLD